MGRSRYTIRDPGKPQFLTCTVLEWLAVFTRPDAVQILLDAWAWQREHKGLNLYGFVVLENHLHFVAQAERLDHLVPEFKSYTARRIIDLLEAKGATRILERLEFAKKGHKGDREHQFWQEGSHPEEVFTEAMMREKLDYCHYNPVKRGYVALPEHWRYSSAANYAGEKGLIEVDRWF
jgi:putative transposase